jgi:uncharacterized membrane protein
VEYRGAVDTFATAVLLAATVDLGLAAGLFATFSYAVMPGLRRVDDPTFVAAMRSMNAAIINGWFALVFVGSLVLTIVAVIVYDDPAWIVAALVLYVAVLVITGVVNVPLNNALAAVGDRAAFERRWVRWNVVRTIGSVAAFGCLVVAVARDL